jgi:hypothetical protein
MEIGELRHDLRGLPRRRRSAQHREKIPHRNFHSTTQHLTIQRGRGFLQHANVNLVTHFFSIFVFVATPHACNMLKPAISPSPLYRLWSRQWTCARCRNQLPGLKNARPANTRRYGAFSGSYRRDAPRNGSRKAILWASAGTTGVTASVLAFGEEIKQSYEGAERTGRVAAALMVCINE